MLPSPSPRNSRRGGSGLGRYRGPVGKTNLLGAGAHLKHGPAAPTLSRTAHPSSAPGCSYVLLRQLISRFGHCLRFLSGNLPSCHGIAFSCLPRLNLTELPGAERREIVIEPNGVYNFAMLRSPSPVFAFFFAWSLDNVAGYGGGSG